MEYAAKHQMVRQLIVFGGGFYWFQLCLQFFHLQRIVELNFYMTKLQIEGKYFSYSILELKKDDALQLQSIMEKELVPYDKIFFERKDFKKLGFKKLEDITVVEHFSGFLSEPPRFLALHGVFTLFQNKKKVFASSLDRLEERYHMGLYKEFCELKSTIGTKDLNYKKRKGYKYFFLKKEQSGKFTTQFDKGVALNQLLFQHINLFRPNSNYHPTQLVNVIFEGSIIRFAVRGKPEIKNWVEAFK
jgi:hypothetical protein